MKLIKIHLIFLFLLIFTGCSFSSHIIVGKTRPSILPEQVRLYTNPPQNYEEVAIVDASSRGSWSVTDQGKMEAAIERLKAEAAKLGANGVLLQGTGDLSIGAVGGGTVNSYGNSSYGYGLAASILHKSAKGMAIYVYKNE